MCSSDLETEALLQLLVGVQNRRTDGGWEVIDRLAAGATQREIAETIWQMSMFGGLPAMQKALELAQAVFAEEESGK